MSNSLWWWNVFSFNLYLELFILKNEVHVISAFQISYWIWFYGKTCIVFFSPWFKMPDSYREKYLIGNFATSVIAYIHVYIKLILRLMSIACCLLSLFRYTIMTLKKLPAYLSLVTKSIIQIVSKKRYWLPCIVWDHPH